MKKRAIYILFGAGAAVLLVTGFIAVNRVPLTSSMPAIKQMVEADKLPGAVKALKANYQFDNRAGLDALEQFSITVLREGLHSDDPFERCYSATSLAAYNDWSGLAIIDNALNSSNFLLEKAAVEGLAQAADNPRALDLLERFYRSSDRNGRLMAIQSFREVKTRGVEPLLIDAIRQPSDLTVWAVNALGHLGDPKAVPLLEPLMTTSKDSMVRAEAAHSLLLLGERSDGVEGVIEKELANNNPQEASEAALALGDARDRREVARLEQLEVDTRANARVRLAAAVALTWYGDDKGLGLIRSAISDPNYTKYLPPLLSHLNFQVARQVVIQALSSGDVVVRLAATEAIGLSGQPQDIASLVQHMTSISEPTELAQVAWSLGRIGRQDCLPVLLDLVQNPSQQIRNTAADALVRTALTLRARV